MPRGHGGGGGDGGGGGTGARATDAENGGDLSDGVTWARGIASVPGVEEGFGGEGGGEVCRTRPALWEVFIVMELCPCGSLRAALDAKKFHNKKGVPHLHEVRAVGGLVVK